MLQAQAEYGGVDEGRRLCWAMAWARRIWWWAASARRTAPFASPEVATSITMGARAPKSAGRAGLSQPRMSEVVVPSVASRVVQRELSGRLSWPSLNSRQLPMAR